LHCIPMSSPVRTSFCIPVPLLMNSSPSPAPCRVAIVEDHTIMREGLKLMVNNINGFEWAWMAGSAAAALQMLEQDVPDLLLVDITLPDRNGLELIKDVHALHPSLKMMVISMHDEKLYVQRALRAGARGYLTKDASHAEYEKAFVRVAAGGVSVSDAFSEEVLLAFASGGTAASSKDGLDLLTDRELEIFQLLGEGRNTPQIAEALRISTKTVDVHKMNMRTKLQLEDGAAVVRHAIRWFETRRLGGG
jgi:DNA-binding NarL/FixJ family response regulator